MSFFPFLSGKKHSKGGRYIAFDGSNQAPTVWKRADEKAFDEEDLTDATSSMSMSQSDQSQQLMMDSSNASTSGGGVRRRQDSSTEGGLAIVHRSPDSINEQYTTEKDPLTGGEGLAIARPSAVKNRASSQSVRLGGYHALVNAHRKLADPNLKPLKRSQELDDLARWHVEIMAAESRVFHADAVLLCFKMAKRPSIRLGQNVFKGQSAEKIQNKVMDNSSFANVIDERYTEMGMATAKDKKGVLYLCQLFRG